MKARRECLRRGLVGAWRRFILVAVLAVAGCPSDGPSGQTDGLAADHPPISPDRGRDQTPQTPPVITDVVVEKNPTSTISCFIRFRSSRSATPFVEFGSTPAVTYRIDGTQPGLTHRLIVYGMRAQTAYALVAGARAADGQEGRASKVSFTTGELPSFLPRAELVTYDSRRAHNGWTLMTLSAGDRSPTAGVSMDPDFRPTAVMYDMEGEPVWYFIHDMPRNGDCRYIDGHILAQSMGELNEPKLSAIEVDLGGQVVWEGPRQPVGSVDGHYNHHFEKLANGNYVAIRNRLIRTMLGDEIVIMQPDHRIIWSWDSFDHVRPDMSLWTGTGVLDYMHGNSLQVDLDRGVLYYNARHQSLVFKIDRATGKVLWRLGAKGDFKMAGSVNFPWFEQAHAVEVQPNGNVLLYDNGLDARGFSRAVEYKLDEQKMTAAIAWEYSGFPNDPFQTLYWGDADRLPNGNTLICAGTWAKKVQTRIMEVTRSWEKVWEIRLPIMKKTTNTIGAYNAQRLTPPLTVIRKTAASGDGGPGHAD